MDKKAGFIFYRLCWTKKWVALINKMTGYEVHRLLRETASRSKNDRSEDQEGVAIPF